MSDFKEYYYLSFLSNLENKTMNLSTRKEIVCYPKLNDGSRILDIGAYGKSAYLGPGKNTSDFLSEFYTNCLIDGINLQHNLEIKTANINLITGDFFKYKPKYKYDYIINDLTYRHNRSILQSDYLLTEVPKILNKGGYYLQYTFRNDGSNSEDVNVAIMDREVRRDFLHKFWKIDKTELLPDDMFPILQEKLSTIYDIIFCKKELERDYINWFMLRLK